MISFKVVKSFFIVWLKFGDFYFYTLKCFQTAGNDAADSFACEVVVFSKVLVKITFL